MKSKAGILPYSIAFFIFVFTCLFCNWPNFHAETHIGLEYHWALDILFHGGYFFVASLALQWLLNHYCKTFWICAALWTLGFLLEIIQIWIPGRSFTLLDLFSNTLGIGMGYLAFSYIEKKSTKSL